MDSFDIFGLTLAFFLCASLFLVIKNGANQRRNPKRLPPGPKPWPIVGNILQLAGRAPHRTLADFAQEHGPIITLWLGSMRTVVISSNEAAREMFKNHDMVLAGRMLYDAMRGHNNNEGSLITAQYGPYWRTLRRLCTTEFFVASRINAMQCVRSKCIDQLLQFIEEAVASGSKAINVGRFFSLMSFNLIGNVMFSKDLLDPKSERGARFFHHAEIIMELSGKPNIADFWPTLRYFDPQGIRRKCQSHIMTALKIAREFLTERMETTENRSSDEKKKDYLDVLLEYENNNSEGPSRFTIDTINAIVLEMFIAGTDTTTKTLEWAMAEILHNPDVLQKVKSELRNTVKPGEKLEEQDLENLPYLNAVIKETLRLHPPLPFLVPHMAIDSCNMLGYHIPKGTQILVNIWAIGRDPKTWKDPEVFKPQRFLEPNSADYKGHHFEFLPFGSGRRMCPAVPLASRMLPLTIGSVLNSFDWVLSDGMKPADMDMKEKIGLTLRKAVPLEAIPTRSRDQI